ncbi:MAG: hypothetical protein ACKO1J_01765, partial [Tagaea sp.]
QRAQPRADSLITLAIRAGEGKDPAHRRLLTRRLANASCSEYVLEIRALTRIFGESLPDSQIRQALGRAIAVVHAVNEEIGAYRRKSNASGVDFDVLTMTAPDPALAARTAVRLEKAIAAFRPRREIDRNLDLEAAYNDILNMPFRELLEFDRRVSERSRELERGRCDVREASAVAGIIKMLNDLGVRVRIDAALATDRVRTHTKQVPRRSRDDDRGR